MSNIINSLYNIRFLDELSVKETPIHRLHPVMKLLTTVVYLTVVISFERYEIIGLLSFVFYPVLTFILAELPFTPVLKRILLVQPFIIGIGILNPLFDNNIVIIGGITMSRGWITFLSIFIKCGLTVTASILLIATTGMDKLAVALRRLKVPKIFVLQLLLTYRYIYVLIEEISRMMTAYSLRAPGQKGIHRSVWGSFLGQLMLRTLDRAESVYNSMSLRGFTGEFNIGDMEKLKFKDFVYLITWSTVFIMTRIYNIPTLIGSLVIGVIK